MIILNKGAVDPRLFVDALLKTLEEEPPVIFKYPWLHEFQAA
jgi:hypothetical protein